MLTSHLLHQMPSIHTDGPPPLQWPFCQSFAVPRNHSKPSWEVMMLTLLGYVFESAHKRKCTKINIAIVHKSRQIGFTIIHLTIYSIVHC